MNSKQVLELQEQLSKIEIDINGKGYLPKESCSYDNSQVWVWYSPLSGHKPVTAQKMLEDTIAARKYAASLLDACDRADALIDDAIKGAQW